MSCLFTLSIVTFKCKSFKFCPSPVYLLFSYVACTFGNIFKKSLPNPMYKAFPLFSSKSFIVLALNFRSLLHFELVFVLPTFKAEKALHSIDGTCSA